MLKLSQRLGELGQMVPQGTRVADIGTDHALLPCYLVLQKIVPFVIGVEVRRGPYQTAWRNIKKYGLGGQIEVRLGDGFSVLKPGEVETVVLTGMGGTTICNILKQDPRITDSLQNIIVQPMGNESVVRYWLVENGWSFLEEKLIFEDKQYYQLFRVGRLEQGGKAPILTEIEAVYGPLLLKNRHPLLVRLIEKDLKGWQEIVHKLAKSNKAEAKRRLWEYEQKIQGLRELQQGLIVVDNIHGGE